MKSLNIGIISHLKYPIREPFSGGLEMHTYMLAEGLRARGHRVTLFAADQSDASLGVEPICAATALAAVGTDEARDVSFFQEHHAYLILMQRLRYSDFDLIHNNSLHYLPVSLADLLPMPMVTTLHTPPFCWLESGFVCEKGHNNTTVAISKTVAHLWARVMKVDEIILNGIDLGQFAYHNEAEAPVYAIWYGRIVPEKGLHYALDAAHLAGIPLKIAGPVSDQVYFAHEIAPRFTRFSDTCEYLGHVEHAQLATLIGGASVSLCTPCWEEPYGLVVVESLAAGVPVAGFSRGALPELIDEQSGALATPDSAIALQKAIERAMKCTRAACRARAEAVADKQVMLDHYEALYRRLVFASSTFAERKIKSSFGNERV